MSVRFIFFFSIYLSKIGQIAGFKIDTKTGLIFLQLPNPYGNKLESQMESLGNLKKKIDVKN